MTSLYIYDHRPGFDINNKNSSVADHLKIDHILRALPEEYQIIDNDNSQISHAITHYSSNRELNNLESGLNIDKYADLQIFFCVTTRSGYPEKERKHQKKTSGNKTRYILYGRRLDELNKPEVLAKVLKAFCSLTVEQADAIVEKDFDKMPKDLINIFHLIRVDNLTALSILCQGYLAVHKGNPIYSEVEKLNLIDNIKQKQQRTEESEWWQYPFNNKNQASLIKEIEEEWQPEKLPSEISDLIDAIYKDERITEDKVQKAYGFIVKRLIEV